MPIARQQHCNTGHHPTLGSNVVLLSQRKRAPSKAEAPAAESWATNTHRFYRHRIRYGFRQRQTAAACARRVEIARVWTTSLTMII